MPSRDVHRPAGMAVGGAFAGARAYAQYKDCPDWLVRTIIATLGGIGGGWLGGAMPDWIDPPTSPNHRNYGHGVATVIGVIGGAADWLAGVQKKFRDKADQLQRDRWMLNSDFERAISIAAEFILRLLAGVIDGVLAGYASHLTLDAFSASSLPVFARGM